MSETEFDIRHIQGGPSWRRNPHALYRHSVVLIERPGRRMNDDTRELRQVPLCTRHAEMDGVGTNMGQHSAIVKHGACPNPTLSEA